MTFDHDTGAMDALAIAAYAVAQAPMSGHCFNVDYVFAYGGWMVQIRKCED